MIASYHLHQEQLGLVITSQRVKARMPLDFRLLAFLRATKQAAVAHANPPETLSPTHHRQDITLFVIQYCFNNTRGQRRQLFCAS